MFNSKKELPGQISIREEKDGSISLYGLIEEKVVDFEVINMIFPKRLKVQRNYLGFWKEDRIIELQNQL